MSFDKKSWEDRVVEFPGRRQLTNVSTFESVTYDVARNEGQITSTGDAFNADNMNDLEERIYSAINQAKLDAHPVGTYYWTSENVNPSTMFGGVWEQVKDVFLLAAGNTYPAGSTGGEATHTLTINEMPAHTHTWNSNYQAATSGGSFNAWGLAGTASGVVTSSVGGGNSHNNMPPYVAAYCWRRIA